MTAGDVAHWMLLELTEHGVLYQQEAADEILDRFGDGFIYENNNGNLAIPRPVLVAFRALDDSVVWVRSERCWRFREEGDEPGRSQEC